MSRQRKVNPKTFEDLTKEMKDFLQTEAQERFEQDGWICLANLGEDFQETFDIEYDDFEDRDLSFQIFQFLSWLNPNYTSD